MGILCVKCMTERGNFIRQIFRYAILKFRHGSQVGMEAFSASILQVRTLLHHLGQCYLVCARLTVKVRSISRQVHDETQLVSLCLSSIDGLFSYLRRACGLTPITVHSTTDPFKVCFK